MAKDTFQQKRQKILDRATGRIDAFKRQLTFGLKLRVENSSSASTRGNSRQVRHHHPICWAGAEEHMKVRPHFAETTNRQVIA